MPNPNFKVLIIEPSIAIQKELSEILKAKKFIIKVVNNASDGIQQIVAGNFDLIICQYELGDYSGFYVYKNVEKYLLDSSAIFFLIVKNFEAEDFLIGMELGIDSFIFLPLNENLILRKINRHMHKLNAQSIFDSKRFKTFFDTSPVAKFIAHKVGIIKYNNTFQKIFNLKDQPPGFYSLRDLFVLDENQQNRLNFRKLDNGLIEYCCLKKVKYIEDLNFFFDIHLYNFVNEKNARILAEVIPVGTNSIYKTLNKIYPEDDTYSNKLINRSEKKNNSSLIELTRREKEIFEESAKGYPIKQIAINLNLSERTVEKHRSNIMHKTNSHSILEAILILKKNSINETELIQ